MHQSLKFGSRINKIAELTSIQIYKDEWINENLSSLTIPKVLFDLQRIPEKTKEISIDYVIKKISDFECQLN